MELRINRVQIKRSRPVIPRDVFLSYPSEYSLCHRARQNKVVSVDGGGSGSGPMEGTVCTGWVVLPVSVTLSLEELGTIVGWARMEKPGVLNIDL